MIGYSAGPIKKATHYLTPTYGQYVRHVWLLDIKSKKLLDLTPESPYHHMFVSWSPDGRWVSYTSFVNPWWTFFVDTDWEVYIMEVDDKNHLPFKVGKGRQSQWIDNNKLVISDGNIVKLYDIQTKNVVKEFKVHDQRGFGYYSIGKSIETLFYASYAGGEGEVSKVKMFDLKSRKTKELIYNAKNPTYIK